MTPLVRSWQTIRRYGFVLTLLLGFLYPGCAPVIAPRHPALRHAELPALIPVRAFVANPKTNFGYKLSPDGKKLAWIKAYGLGTSIFVRTLGQGGVKILPFSGRFHWAQDSQRLFVLGGQGAGNVHVFMADTDHPDQPLVDLTPFEETRTWIHQILHADPAHILIVHNRRDKAVFDLYRVNLETQKHTLMAQNPGDVVSWLTDDQGNLRGRMRHTPTEHRLELWYPSQQTWKTRAAWRPGESVAIVGFNAENKGIWLLSNRARDRIALVQLHGETGGESLIYADPRVNVKEVVFSRVEHKPMMAVSYPDYQHIHFFDAALQAGLMVFQQHEPTGLKITSADNQERLFTITTYTPTGIASYLYNRKTRQKTLLGQHPIAAHAAALSPVQPIAFTSRDGWELHGYLTVPQGTSGTSLPMVLLVHGGPWDRDYWGYNSLVQLLANRGYAVLQINFRGSTGYGRAFTEAAIGEFAGKMQADLLDGVNWAIHTGIADPQHIAIVGGSYGGYATLVGLSFTPEVFACGVDIAGISDLVMFVESGIESAPTYWKDWMAGWYKYVGDPRRPDERRRMQEKSPLFRAENITRPLLVLHGRKDSLVKPEQSEQIVSVLKQAGKDVEYVRLAGEGHRGYHWRNRLTLYRKVEDFLARCLGGRSRGFDLFQMYQLPPR